MNENRPLRLSVPPDLYEVIDGYAKATGTTVAESARMLLWFGAGVVEALVEKEAAA